MIQKREDGRNSENLTWLVALEIYNLPIDWVEQPVL